MQKQTDSKKFNSNLVRSILIWLVTTALIILARWVNGKTTEDLLLWLLWIVTSTAGFSFLLYTCLKSRQKDFALKKAIVWACFVAGGMFVTINYEEWPLLATNVKYKLMAIGMSNIQPRMIVIVAILGLLVSGLLFHGKSSWKVLAALLIATAITFGAPEWSHYLIAGAFGLWALFDGIRGIFRNGIKPWALVALVLVLVLLGAGFVSAWNTTAP